MKTQGASYAQGIYSTEQGLRFWLWTEEYNGHYVNLLLPQKQIDALYELFGQFATKPEPEKKSKKKEKVKKLW